MVGLNTLAPPQAVQITRELPAAQTTISLSWTNSFTAPKAVVWTIPSGLEAVQPVNSCSSRP